MNKLEAARKIIAKYGLLGPDELEDALRTCPDNTNPMTHLLKLNLINERQESMLKMRLEVELAGEAPAAKQPVEPQQVEGDVAEIEEIPEEELEPIDPSELAPARTERKRPRRRVRPQRRAAAPELVEVPEIIEPEPLPDADELRGKPLGEILVALKLAHNDDIGDAAEEQGRSEGTVSELHIGEILVRKGVVTRRELITALTMQGRALLQCDTCAIVGTNSTEEPISRLDCPNCGGRMLSVESPEVGEDALPVVDLRGYWFALAAGASYKDFTVRKRYSNDRVHSVTIGAPG